MGVNPRARWLNLLHTLWFVPSVISVAYVALAESLVRLDSAERFRNAFVFGGDGHAARTVLSVIAGSLITVAGLTFSVTMIVLQLTSSQFSPRVLRNYLGDRVAQVTIGSFIGIFAYCLLALRSVGDVADGAPVPRLTITVASALALFALAMLIAFINHIAQLVQASELIARLSRQTLKAIERLYPEQFGGGAESLRAADLLACWREDGSPGLVLPDTPGFVQTVELGSLLRGLPEPRPRLHVLVAPGDFAFADEPIAEVWPREAADDVRTLLRRTITVGGERDIDQDAHFGVRQLTDIALRAISPGVIDPTTAATCIAYIRAALTRLAAREFPSGVREDRENEPLVVRRRSFNEYLEAFAEIARYGAGDARIAGDLLAALAAVAAAAAACGADERVRQTLTLAESIGEQALDEARSSRDRALVTAALQGVEAAAAVA